MKRYDLNDWCEHFDKVHGEGAAAELEQMLADQQMTFREIGQRFGVTKQRVSQLVALHFPRYLRRVAGNVQSRRGHRE